MSRVYFVVGCASGLGKAIVEEFSKAEKEEKENNDNDVHFVLASKNTDKVEELKRELSNLSARFKFHIFKVDLSNTEETKECVKESFQCLENLNITPQMATLVLNSGSLGKICPVKDLNDKTSYSELVTYFMINVVSMFPFLSAFLKQFQKVPKCRVIQITSLVGIVPFKGWSKYGSAKAARDMIMNVIAQEHAMDDNIKSLSYSPGPLETSMSVRVRDRIFCLEQKASFNSLLETNTYVRPNASAKKMIELLKQDNFKSGIHFDFYDDLPQAHKIVQNVDNIDVGLESDIAATTC